MKHILFAVLAAYLSWTSSLAGQPMTPQILTAANSFQTGIDTRGNPISERHDALKFSFRESNNRAIKTNIAAKPNLLSFTPQQFGAAGDGSRDDHAAIQLADAAASLAGRALYFPGGTYNTSVPLVPATGAHWTCEAYQTTTIRTTSPTADLINAINSFFVLDECQLQSSVTRAGGAYLRLHGSDYRFTHILAQSPFNALVAENNVANLFIDDFQSENAIAGSGADFVINGCTNCLWSKIVLTNGSAARPFTHLKLVNSNDIHCYDCNFLQGQSNIYISPGNGQSVASFKMIGGYVDEAGVYAAAFVPSGTGSINKILFVGTWFVFANGGTAAMQIAPTGTSKVDFIQCLGCEFYGDASSSGYAISATQPVGTTVSNLQFIGGVVGGVDVGFDLAGVSSFQISDLDCGNLYSPAPKTCISLSGAIGVASIHDVHNSSSATPLSNTATITTSNIHNNY